MDYIPFLTIHGLYSFLYNPRIIFLSLQSLDYIFTFQSFNKIPFLTILGLYLWFTILWLNSFLNNPLSISLALKSLDYIPSSTILGIYSFLYIHISFDYILFFIILDFCTDTTILGFTKLKNSLRSLQVPLETLHTNSNLKNDNVILFLIWHASAPSLEVPRLRNFLLRSFFESSKCKHWTCVYMFKTNLKVKIII